MFWRIVLVLCILLVPVDSFSRDSESNLRKFGKWESSLFHVGATNEDWYMTKYYSPQPPDLFAFSAHSVFPDCDLLTFIIYLFQTKIVQFERNNLIGEINIDGHKSKIFYNVFSDGSGTFFVEITSFQNGNEDQKRMVSGKNMTINLPHLLWTGKVDLRGFTKTLDRSTLMCIDRLHRP